MLLESILADTVPRPTPGWPQTEDLNRLNVLHITGTKGKGSTTAFCDSLLRSLHRNHPPPSGAPLRVGELSPGCSCRRVSDVAGLASCLSSLAASG